MAGETFGFIGLGNMGGPMARHAAATGREMVVHDIAGTADRAPEGAAVAQSNGEVARRAGIVALSLPTVAANREVVLEIAAAGRKGQIVIDTCTIGPAAARENARILAEAGIAYLDSPVSGMKFRAEEGTLASMASGPEDVLERAKPMVEAWSRTVFHVGLEPGLGQTMKLVNNALNISGLVASTEAVAYGERAGLDVATMLAVINASTGQNFTTLHAFPKHVATGDLDGSGAEAHLVKKDLGLFVESAGADDAPCPTIVRAYDTVAAFADSDPAQDMIRIYPFVRDGAS
ncbi:MAG: NAD(P)-dependent oxidoreductase [Alphaproteobacteria bacterium]|nr:NAD(P)-dependent oxidoreductase [Alphaproteobacteria bacterium]